VLDRLCVNYQDNSPSILQDVSAEFDSDSKVGILGQTGSGKSSLLLAFLRLNNLVSGSISIGGVDTRDMDLKRLRKDITWVPQNPSIFTGTVRFNLDPCGEFDDNFLVKYIVDCGLTASFTTSDPDKQTILSSAEVFNFQGKQLEDAEEILR